MRPRPEQPSDSDAIDLTATERRSARQRRKRDAEESESAEPEWSGDDGAGAGPETAPAPASEAESEPPAHEVAAEAVFRERIALRELADRLPPEMYRAIEQVLAGQPGRWRLEKGRYLLIALVGERTIQTAGRSVQVEQKVAIARDEPPAEPVELDRRIAEVATPLPPDASVEEVVRTFDAVRNQVPPEDELRIRLAPEQPEIVITADSVTVDESPNAELAERAPAASVDRSASSPAAETPAIVEVPAAHIDRIRAEVESEAPDIEETPEPRAEPDAEAGLEPEPRTLADVMAMLDREAVALHDLPPIAGGEHQPPRPPEPAGSPRSETEPPEPEPEEEKPEEALPALKPERPAANGTPPEFPTPRPSRRKPHHPVREVLNWEPGWAEVVRRPDHEMRKRGRKLVRRLAAEYGLRLTPQLEAYLLAILLRPKLINGRLVHGLGLNLDHVVSVIKVLKYQFNFTRPPRL